MLMAVGTAKGTLESSRGCETYSEWFLAMAAPVDPCEAKHWEARVFQRIQRVECISLI